VTRRPVRGIALLVIAIVCLLAVLALATTAEDYPPGEVEGQLAMTDGQGMSVTALGDSVGVELDCRWTGLPPGVSPVLVVDPLPDGWDYVVSRAVRKDEGFAVPLDGRVELTINLSKQTPAGSYYLEPRLDNPIGEGALVSIPLLVQVAPYSLEMDLAYLPRSARPGERLEGELLVWATAPVTRNVPVRLDWVAEGWSVQLQRDTVRLDKGTPTSVRFTVTPPVWALPGDYAVMFSATTTDPRCTAAALETHVAIGSHPSLGLAALPDILSADPGGSATTNVTVVNGGNVAHKVIAVTHPEDSPFKEGWSITYADLPTSIAPFDEATFRVTVRLPDDPDLAKAGLSTVPVRVLTGDTSQDLLFNLVVRVSEMRDLTLALAGTDGNATGFLFGPTDGWRLDTELLVTDRGNLRGLRHVDIRADYSFPVQSVFFSPPYLLSSTGMVQAVKMTVLLDGEAEPGTHPVTVTVYDEGGGRSQLALGGKVPGVSASLSLSASSNDGTVSTASQFANIAPLSIDLTGEVVLSGDDDVDYAEVQFYYTDSALDGQSQGEMLGYVPMENLSKDETRSFSFTYDALEPGDHVVEARFVVPGTTTDTDDFDASVPLTALPKDPDGEPLALVPLVLGAAVGALAGILAVLGTEAGKYALLLMLVVPLYTRLKPDQVKDQFVRGQILGYVKANPGETYSAIRRALKLSNGQFVYHARILESQNLIRSVKDGANRRFYPEGMRIPREVKDVQLNQVQRIIYTIILEYPGISQSRIAKMMELAPSTVNYHVNIMTKVGVIERKRSGRLSLCFAADDRE
jgi:predicted transcriptional regulator